MGKNIKNTSSYKVNKLNFEKDYNELIEKIDFLYETYDKVDPSQKLAHMYLRCVEFYEDNMLPEIYYFINGLIHWGR